VLSFSDISSATIFAEKLLPVTMLIEIQSVLLNTNDVTAMERRKRSVTANRLLGFNSAFSMIVVS
jgi:hypothetical protein